MSSYKSVFEQHEREKRLREEEERRRREEEERKRAAREAKEARVRQEAARHRKQQMDNAARRFDTQVKQILQDYGAVKMKTGLFTRKRVDGPNVGYSNVTWSLRCQGYYGVEIALEFSEASAGTFEAVGFSISGTSRYNSGPFTSINELVNALADSEPEVYVRSRNDSSSSYTCDMGIY